MFRFIFPIVTIAAIMTVGACSGGDDPVADGANSAAAAEIDVLPPDESTSNPTGELEGEEPANGEQTAASSKIPASMHGRWGLTPGDCTSTRGDNKGLLIVSADQMKFYESSAKPSGALETSANSVRGDFAFTGEGMTWKRFEVLELQDSKLIRTESGPMASYTYVRCGANV